MIGNELQAIRVGIQLCHSEAAYHPERLATTLGEIEASVQKLMQLQEQVRKGSS